MSSAVYPILERRSLDPAEKARWFGRKNRKLDDLPRPAAHQSLVYLVAGDLVVDDGQMSMAGEQIVNATNVSVVDMRRDALVVVRIDIPSADASYFEVLVTFRCTVDDPVAVVGGGVNASEALQGHLKAHNRIFELGLGYKLTEVNEVRRMVSAQVRAYLTHVPARVSGMQVRFANVEVSSPKELIDFEGNVRSKTFANKLDQQEAEYLQQKDAGSAAHHQAMESGRRDHEIDLDGRSHRHDLRKASASAAQDLELDGWSHAHGLRKASADVEHELDMVQQRGAVARSEFDRNVEMLNGDPKRALLAAYAAGQLDAQGLSVGLKAIDDSLRDQAVHVAQQERDEKLALQAAKLEERRIERGWQREDSDREAELKHREEVQARVDRLRREKEKREDQLRKEQIDRDDKLREEQAGREDQQRLNSMRFEILKQMAAQGHFNTTDLGGGSLFAEVMRMPQAEVEQRHQDAVGKRVAEQLESGGVREEDE
ncbi:hypothetical protein AB0J72_20260 [Dactylosporangium sp. NPDC049742]|uniref:hypothetical protein n=1 Tax=Dactylosporangium sp. NPDC049742 TaxID=3154737 RepID=UPI00343401A8